jgi:hypothetical protein
LVKEANRVDHIIKVGIGFATGRKHFQSVLRSYIFNCKEAGLMDNENISLNLFVVYDLDYMGTKYTDYTAINPDVAKYLDSAHFIGTEKIKEAARSFVGKGIINETEAAIIFEKGYASSRNIILYEAIKAKMDCLIFIDDDEYPVAVTKNGETALWGGQQVIKTHLLNIKNADITYGYHCGYISPIPNIEFSHVMAEDVFRKFIQAISNDIINWETMKKVMSNGGITYADTSILIEKRVTEVPEINNAKFISGSNLCINLTRPERVYPFFNPPGARGEDTFLSTCLHDRKVLSIPCYTFHDGFSAYRHLLAGVLPIKLKPIRANSERLKKRFYNACVGWIRYKPLYLYITDRERYKEEIEAMKQELDHTLPSICKYFGSRSFMNIKKELEKYEREVETHYLDFLKAPAAWLKIIASL